MYALGMPAAVRRRFGFTVPLLGLIALAWGCAGAPPAGGPAAAPSSAATQARMLFSKAEGYFFKGLYPEAVREYTALLAVEPANATGYRCRAAAHAALRQDAEALADYRRALELAPRDDDAWTGRGLFHFARGRYAEAIEDFDRAIALDAANAVPHDYKARACDKIGKYREAAEARQNYIHCTIPREDAAARERPPAREIKALGLE
jgi:tetratricopeptide (TPR) repeat protein